MQSADSPFQFDAGSTFLARWIGRGIEELLAFRQLNRLHAQARRPAAEHFVNRALDALRVRLRFNAADLDRIPRTGPLIVVANHPFGGLDGLALLSLLLRRRPDVKIVANHVLGLIPEMRDMSLFVDPFGGEGAASRNLTGLRAAIRWLRDSKGVLAIFPAGEVSHLNLRARGVADGAWSPHAGTLLRLTGAAALPVYFSGRNSGWFQSAGLLSPKLRTVMLPRELLAKRGSTINLCIGNVVTPGKVREFESDEDLASYLKVRTYVLAAREPAGPTQRPRNKTTEPIVSQSPGELIAAEINCLPADRVLAQSGDLRVVYADASELRWTLQEIGRLREVTFRQVGEGTGRPLDLDRFDQTYLHLLAWNGSKREVVGAYRMGLIDRLIAGEGSDGLYTATLFHFRPELIEQLGPAIELGRSFVRPEYQKEYAPLMLLWKGIATFVARRPEYRMLFGPVSISNEYHSLSRQLLIEFLKRNSNASATALQKLVRPRHPPPRAGPARDWPALLAGTVVRSIRAVDELVGEIESDRAGMPVLLRQYLKLNAKLLGFNVDPDFGDVLDGLMLVDLTQVSPAILTRYMGREQAAAFLAHHSTAKTLVR